MSRIVYVNGRYLPYARASVHAEDRGFQFADAVYEVCEVWNGTLVDETRHMARLERSLAAIAIPAPMSRRALGLVLREVIRRNRVSNGLVYLQVSRGAGPRDFLFPGPGVAPTVVAVARALDPVRVAAKAAAGISVITLPEMRWARSDIKTVMLLPACLAKDEARKAGAQEAWFVDREGYVTEGASSNAWIVGSDGRLVTRALSAAILPGVTRLTLLDLAQSLGIVAEERAFTRAEAISAREAFVTSASATVMPVVRIDGAPIGDAHPGAITNALRQKFHQAAELRQALAPL